MRVLPRYLLVLLLSLAACGAVEDEDLEGGPTGPSCALDEGSAPLLDQALAVAGLSRDDFGFSDDDMAEAGYLPVLDDPFRLPWFVELRGRPARAGCFEGETVWPLDSALLGDHPASDAILHAAALLDRLDAAAPRPGDGQDATDFAAEVAALCAGPAGPCGQPGGELPADLGHALAPVIRAIAEGVAARAAMDEELIQPDFWAYDAGFLLFGFNFDRTVLGRADVAGYMLGRERAALNAAAARIAWAVESTRWSSFAGRPGVRFDLSTGAGAIQIRGGEADTHADDADVLLRVDLGGDDTYVDAAAANRSGANSVSVVIDLAGNDTYTYDTVPSPNDRAGLLPSDRAGRYAGNTDEECAASGACTGPVSLSVASRQGAARNGIAMLFDLGGDDSYRSLRASQGYAQYGVGVLLDAGGNDVYLAEAQSQGAAQFGIGLAIDVGGGADERRSITESQGFGYVGGAGFLLDDGGDDVYFCDHGDPARGGVRVYGSPQTRVTGNSSFCQGAGFGARLDQDGLFLSGGLGLLRDVSGNDRYDASVFGQGTGYWQGTGILSDGGGSDRYQADWYVQGAAAHYAVGMLLDDGPGDDVFDEDKLPNNMSLGSGHDYSVGVLINEAGNDTYHVTTLAVGSSNCNGVGLFVDNGGDDRYLATSDYNEGMGNVSDECRDTRPSARSMGIMIDAGGRDTYEGPASEFPRPANDTTWNHVRSSHPGERGGGVDGTGETGIHAGSTR